MINKERLINEFINLTKIDSESFNEKEIQNYVKNKLESLGLNVKEDNSYINYKKYTNSENIANNLYASLKGENDNIILSAHLDTVSPGKNKKAIVLNDRITSDKTTVLGADCLSAVASIIEVLNIIKENNIKHKNIEIVFFVAEEPFAKGSRYFDYSLLKSKEAYVFDLEGGINNVAIKAPAIISFDVKIKGKASHAGFNPEDGINALSILNDALNEIKLGRLDEFTTLNIGIINGGSGVNIVPELIELKGEIRSLDNAIAKEKLNELEKIFTKNAESYGGGIDFSYEKEFDAYQIDKDDNIVKNYVKALRKINNDEINYIKTFGGSDNNNLNMNKIKGIVIGNGMRNVHSKDEYILIDDLINTAELILNLVSIE